LYFCQNCKALYQIVKVEAGPQTADTMAAYHQLDCLNVISLDRGYKKRPTLNGIKSDDYGW
jgi:hypothetical protein